MKLEGLTGRRELRIPDRGGPGGTGDERKAVKGVEYIINKTINSKIKTDDVRCRAIITKKMFSLGSTV